MLIIIFFQNHVSQGEREVDPDLLDQFIKQYLKTDGVFIFRLISHNTNYITSTEVSHPLSNMDDLHTYFVNACVAINERRRKVGRRYNTQCVYFLA